MILTLSYKGIFRQEQYETATIEGSVTVDTEKDLGGMSAIERRDYMTGQLDTLIRPLLDRAAQASRYSEDETTLYEWKEFTDDTTSDQAPERQQGRRVHRRQ